MLGVPQTHQQAISGPDAKRWQEAMEEEMGSLRENDTYTVTPLPEGRQTVGGRWVYALKDGPGETVRHKARYVAKGYSQVEGIDYNETFSPTARMTSVRILMQLAVQYDLIVHQLDVKTAYLNAPIDQEIYVEQPEGFIVGKSSENLVWRLNKSLYGLKQSGRNWNKTLHDYLVQNGFSQVPAEPCVYIRNSKDGVVIMLVWVDNIIVAASNEAVLKDVKDDWKKGSKCQI